jgi:hypothetical protein
VKARCVCRIVGVRWVRVMIGRLAVQRTALSGLALPGILGRGRRKSPAEAGLSLGHHAWACRGGGKPNGSTPSRAVGFRVGGPTRPHEKAPQRRGASGAKWHLRGVRRVRRTRRYNNDCDAQKKPRRRAGLSSLDPGCRPCWGTATHG